MREFVVMSLWLMVMCDVARRKLMVERLIAPGLGLA